MSGDRQTDVSRLSQTMRKGLMLARMGYLCRVPGGFWVAEPKPRVYLRAGAEKNRPYVGTQTIDALCSRGLLEAAWPPGITRQLTAAGRRAAEEIAKGGAMSEDHPAVVAERDAAIANSLLLELQRARRLHPTNIASQLEGWAVIHEEATELFDAIRGHEPAADIAKEAVQVGAMAIRFLSDLGLGGALVVERVEP